MKICMSDLLFAISYGLDAVENGLVGATTNHSKRVAYLCARLGEEMGFSQQAQLDVAACAVMHDSALTEYIQSELRQRHDPKVTINTTTLGTHCEMGERNARLAPFYARVPEGTILYHHENHDGSGPFHRKGDEVPLQAQMIHVTDIVDVSLNLGDYSDEKYQQVRSFLEAQRGAMFAPDVVDLFLDIFDADEIGSLHGEGVDALLPRQLPDTLCEYDDQALCSLAELFARITDYKSRFTSTHSQGVAEKARFLAERQGYDGDTAAEVYVAGALHDVGKLLVDSAILEKPAALTDTEYAAIKLHVLNSYQMIARVRGMERILPWIGCHHEKLDGSGYPFGKRGDQLGHMERLMACVDIYQALTEDRPYRAGMDHAQAMAILREMVEQGKLDGDIVEDIDWNLRPR